MANNTLTKLITSSRMELAVKQGKATKITLDVLSERSWSVNTWFLDQGMMVYEIGGRSLPKHNEPDMAVRVLTEDHNSWDWFLFDRDVAMLFKLTF